MQTKLTLRLDQGLIDHAKQYAQAHNISVSKLVEKYFSSIESTAHPESLTPWVSSLYGIAKDSEKAEQAYKKHLQDKYL